MDYSRFSIVRPDDSDADPSLFAPYDTELVFPIDDTPEHPSTQARVVKT